jgi:Carboxypeptidase regulatory-like domain
MVGGLRSASVNCSALGPNRQRRHSRDRQGRQRRGAAGATVTLTHTQTARQFTTASTEVGFYLFPSVQTGPYEITVDMPAMETWKGELTLQVGQTAEVNPVLKIRAAATEITVAGNVTPLVTTTDPTLANVVERARIDQLPVNRRLIQNLLYMTTPGFESGSVPRVYGLRYAVEMLQDGAVLENRQWQEIPARPPGLDTIEEFRAETSNSSAKLNRPGTVILTTRAGTNEIHARSSRPPATAGSAWRAPGRTTTRSLRNWCATSSAPRWEGRSSCPASITAGTERSSSSLMKASVRGSLRRGP